LFTFVAYDNGDLAGTVSLRLDSANGLAAEALYQPDIDAFRQPGSRLCEFTRLAIDLNSSSKWVLASLFHTGYLFACKVRGYDSAIIEVNPRHVAFYQRALRFTIIGPERLNPRVNAPAVLLGIRFETVTAGLARYAGRPESSSTTRTLYPYGFSAKDEEGILGRLRAFSESRAEAYA